MKNKNNSIELSLTRTLIEGKGQGRENTKVDKQ